MSGLDLSDIAHTGDISAFTGLVDDNSYSHYGFTHMDPLFGVQDHVAIPTQPVHPIQPIHSYYNDNYYDNAPETPSYSGSEYGYIKSKNLTAPPTPAPPTQWSPKTSRARGRSPNQTAVCTSWILENYELMEGVSLPRNSLYVNFTDFCMENNMPVMNPASFGKIIHQLFPDLKTRRLGIRGQSKYHYYGICVRESSKIRAKLAAHQITDTGRSIYREIVKPLSSAGSLPEFPSVEAANLPPGISKEIVDNFITVYHSHCQQIYGIISMGEFAQIHDVLMKFWSAPTPETYMFLSHDNISYLICHCDDILYKSLLSLLGQNPLEALSSAKILQYREFAATYCTWLKETMSGAPEKLTKCRIDVAHYFVCAINRQTALNRLVKNATVALHDSQNIGLMVKEWNRIDFTAIYCQLLNGSFISANRFKSFQERLRLLLLQQGHISTYLEVMAAFVQEQLDEDFDELDEVYRKFMFSWNSYSESIIRDLTLRASPSFGFFHVLKLMLDEYAQQLFEQRIASERYDILRENAIGESAILEDAFE